MIVEPLLQDTRIGLRLLARRPAFSLMASFSLALGIGLVATQFSLIDGILLRGLPVRDAERLMHVARFDPQQTDPNVWLPVPYRDYVVIQQRQTSFDSLVGINALAVNLSAPGRMPSYRPGALASANVP